MSKIYNNSQRNMIGKIVLTEKGLKLSNELLTINPDDPPPFFEEGKPIQKVASSPKISNLYEKSNGFLDRITLKSAQSNRNQFQNKPFFLPNYEVKDVYEVCPPYKTSKYPGIYPPKTSQSSRKDKINQQLQQFTSTQTLRPQQNLISFKDQPQQLSGLLMSGGHPLVLDLETLNKQSNDIGSNRNRNLTHLQQNFLKNNPGGFDNGGFPFEGSATASKRNTVAMQKITSSQGIGTHQLITGTHQLISHPEESPIRDGLNKFQFTSNKIDDIFRGSLATSNKYELNGLTQQQRRPVNKEKYLESIKNRMDLKKQHYLQQREIQDKKLKEIAKKRADLSREPVHIAAKYLQELKKEDQKVDNLIYDVNFFKTRYKNRLSEYHNQKYQKQWSQFYFPSEKKKTPSPKRVLKQELEDDLDDYDQLSYKQTQTQKSFQKQFSMHSINQNI